MKNKLVKYHPDTRFLTDYAAGSLPESQALCVAAHLHYCPTCRSRIAELTQLGTEFFMEQKPAEITEDSFEHVMAKLEALGSENQDISSDKHSESSSLFWIHYQSDNLLLLF